MFAKVMRAVREKVKRLPLVGAAIHRLYLILFRKEGHIAVIERGHLRGMKICRFNWTMRIQTTYLDGSYETHLQSVMVGNLKPGDVFWDVGANEGFFTLLASVLVGEKGKVVAFEPHPRTCQQLAKQVSINARSNVAIIQKAVADTPGKMQLVDDPMCTMARLAQVKSARGADRTIDVSVTTLDDEFSRCDGRVPDLIKIDVEGAELLVLKGADRLLRERPSLVIEIHTPELASEIHPLLERYGYRVTDSEGRAVEPNQYVRLFVARVS